MGECVHVDRKHAGIAGGLLVLLALTAWLFWPGIHGPFLFDDEPNLRNLATLDSHLSWRAIGNYLSLFTGVPGRPLSALSFILNDDAWPSEPLGFKLTNLWIHLLNGVLVFGLARALGRAWFAPQDATKADLSALLCAATWLLNPIQVSAVFLTVQRMAELAGTCMFAGLWAYVALAVRARTLWHAVLALAVLGVTSLLAVLCKENGALLPLLALVVHATLLRPALASRPAPARWGLQAGLWTAVALLFLAFAWQWPSLTSFSARDYGMWERLMTQARALVRYVSLILMPRMSSSALYNDDFAVSRALLQPMTTLPALLLLVGSLAGAIAARRRMPLLAFAVLWFLAAHAMESSVFPLEMYFEHRNYIPLFGIAFALPAGILRLQGDLRRPLLAAFGAWLLLLGAITYQQTVVWGNERLLSTVWHIEHPRSLRAQQQYANYLFQHGQKTEAKVVLDRAAAAGISPVDTGLEALIVECSAHRVTPRSELDHISSLIRSQQLTPGSAAMLARLRWSVQHGDCPDSIPPATWLALTDAALANPRGNAVWRMLLVERADLYVAMGRLDDAIHQLDVAYGNNGEPRVAFYAAALLATAGRYDEARVWAARPLGRPWTWKNWLAQTDRQARELIAAIDSSKAAAAKAASR